MLQRGPGLQLVPVSTQLTCSGHRLDCAACVPWTGSEEAAWGNLSAASRKAPGLQVRPERRLALPYGSYRLCSAAGGRVERADKHPFCMSRVFYDAAERPGEVWAQAGRRAVQVAPVGL